MERQRRHERAEPHARGARGEPGQLGPGIPRSALEPAPTPIEEVIAQPDRVEADTLRRPRNRHVLRPVNRTLDLGKLDAHAHGRSIRRIDPQD